MLTAASLSVPIPIILSEGSESFPVIDRDTTSFIIRQNVTSQGVNYKQYYNFLKIKQSFNKRLLERKINNLDENLKHTFNVIGEKCSNFDIQEVYADYSPNSNAFRIDMIINDNFLLIVRKTIEEDNDYVAISLSKGDEYYLVDYIDLKNLAKEINDYIKG